MKSIFQSKTAWGAIVSAIIGLLALFDVRITAAETAPVIEAFALISTFALTIYGRLRATVPVKLGKITGKNATLWLLGFICITSATLLQSGCTSTQWGRDNPKAAQLFDSVVHAAIIMAINSEAESSDTIAAHAAELKAAANVAFTEGANEAEVAAIIAESVFAIYPNDPEARDVLLNGFQAALSAPDLAGDGIPSSDADRVLAALQSGHLVDAFAHQQWLRQMQVIYEVPSPEMSPAVAAHLARVDPVPVSSAQSAHHWSDPLWRSTNWFTGIDSLAALRAYHGQ